MSSDFVSLIFKSARIFGLDTVYSYGSMSLPLATVTPTTGSFVASNQFSAPTSSPTVTGPAGEDASSSTPDATAGTGEGVESRMPNQFPSLAPTFLNNKNATVEDPMITTETEASSTTTKPGKRSRPKAAIAIACTVTAIAVLVVAAIVRSRIRLNGTDDENANSLASISSLEARGIGSVGNDLPIGCGERDIV